MIRKLIRTLNQLGLDQVFYTGYDHAENFKMYLSSKQRNIIFSFEKENDVRLSFLGINIFLEKRKIVTNAYRKKSCSNALLFVKFHHETNILKRVLYKIS